MLKYDPASKAAAVNATPLVLTMIPPRTLQNRDQAVQASGEATMFVIVCPTCCRMSYPASAQPRASNRPIHDAILWGNVRFHPEIGCYAEFIFTEMRNSQVKIRLRNRHHVCGRVPVESASTRNRVWHPVVETGPSVPAPHAREAPEGIVH